MSFEAPQVQPGEPARQRQHNPEDEVSVEVVVAITWEAGHYSARCLGIPDICTEGESMADAVIELAAVLERHFSAGGGTVGRPDRSVLWQPLPVEMLTPLDIAVA
ncbi:hypothetical protein LVY72_05165 [Arthrobacter sp. I2-34]|uniref:Type II toxin-antitoxin system HicB family antitoxin n=1 Tax=Arthrobacter hankyongi TaxID=2904801 RepID=A0ABS9L3T3_9MICC|nr:hypothetical protein [Arthrobacter hankyongi]MCG2621302.1 hypothetical protein [Arthrobacter hankyongi]